jgi:hypothetical protein
MDYAKIYEEWETLPDCKLHMPGEGLWGKVLPNGYYGVNNMPLHHSYRWQDIVRLRELPDEDDADKVIVHRRWKTQTYYRFTEPAEKDQAMEMRQKLYDALKAIGHPGFVWPGLGYVLLEEEMSDMSAFEKIIEALSSTGIEEITLAS